MTYPCDGSTREAEAAGTGGKYAVDVGDGILFGYSGTGRNGTIHGLWTGPMELLLLLLLLGCFCLCLCSAAATELNISKGLARRLPAQS